MTNFINDFIQASFLSQEASKSMLERLQWMTVQPQVIADLGCGVGFNVGLLKQQYKNAKIIAIENVEALVDHGKKTIPDVEWIYGDLEIVPLEDHSVDLVFANLLIPWLPDLKKFLLECRRILRTNGLLIFSCLGPDTLNELYRLNPDNLLPHLTDMHNVGDALMGAHLADPVIDAETLTVTYRDKQKMLAELRTTGMITKSADFDLRPNAENVYELTFEIVYGHAWYVEGGRSDEPGVFKVPLDQLRGRR